MVVFRLLLFIMMAVSSACGGRILVVYPFFGKSHFFFAAPVFEELAKRGHEVIVASQFPRAKPIDRYTDIDVRYLGGLDLMLNVSDHEVGNGFSAQVRAIFFEALERFEKLFTDDRVENLLNSTEKIDLVITEIFLTDMFVGLAHKLNVPLISMISGTISPWSTERFGIPENPSYIAVEGGPPKSFYERTLNTLKLIGFKVFYDYFITSNDERVTKKYLGEDMPHVKDLMKKTSLLLVNYHFSINGARPLPPNVIPIAGVHIKPPKPLPEDIEKFISESEHGVIYFSLGSVANASSMTESTRKAFCNSFAKLKQRVLWKWEVDELPGKPDNVKTVKWMPQPDVLAHPNVRVFMSHGGLLGTLEGVYNGVPMIGIPIFGDQYQNIEALVNAGSAILLELTAVTEESVSKALHTILEDSNYKTNAQRLSNLFRDRPVQPLDSAVYWIEYVMKHNGAPFLKSAAVDLSWIQYYLIDVIGLFILISALIISLLIYTSKLVLRKCFIKNKVKTQ